MKRSLFIDISEMIYFTNCVPLIVNSLNFIVSPSIVNKDKVNKILDNTCYRTIYLGLRSNCVI